MKKLFKEFALTASLLTSLSASAMTIDFNELATDQTMVNIQSPFQSKGFTFSTTHQWFYTAGRTQAGSKDPGGAAILGHEVITMKQSNGQPFSFYSIDMDDLNAAAVGQPTGNRFPNVITFTFNYVGGTSSQKTVQLDALGGMQTIVFSEYNLLSVNWAHSIYDNTVSGSFFDNVKINVDCGVSSTSSSVQTTTIQQTKTKAKR